MKDSPNSIVKAMEHFKTFGCSNHPLLKLSWRVGSDFLLNYTVKFGLTEEPLWIQSRAHRQERGRERERELQWYCHHQFLHANFTPLPCMSCCCLLMLFCRSKCRKEKKRNGKWKGPNCGCKKLLVFVHQRKWEFVYLILVIVDAAVLDGFMCVKNKFSKLDFEFKY